MRRAGLGILTAAVMALAGAAPASAWWAEGRFGGSEGGYVNVNGEPGETHDLTIRALPGPSVNYPTAPYSVLLHDSKATVTRSDPYCTKVDDHTLNCTAAPNELGQWGISYLYVFYSGAANDRIRIPATSEPIYPYLNTGAGDDSVVVSDLEAANADLGDGNDRIAVHGGDGDGIFYNDYVWGGPGDDVLDLANGRNDWPDCGDGNDRLRADEGDIHAACETVETVPGLP
jgi:hypothetical protein